MRKQKSNQTWRQTRISTSKGREGMSYFVLNLFRVRRAWKYKAGIIFLCKNLVRAHNILDHFYLLIKWGEGISTFSLFVPLYQVNSLHNHWAYLCCNTPKDKTVIGGVEVPLLLWFADSLSWHCHRFYTVTHYLPTSEPPSWIGASQ